MKTLNELECQDKKVFYRPDYNVPIKNGVIVDDFRIISTFPSLDILMEKGAKIIIGTHLGRPDGKVVPELELRPIAEALADHYEDRVIRLAHAIEAVEVEKAISEMRPGDILILPNLRFYPGEEANDPEFANVLADLADFYVNDAFACDHRAHASIVGVPGQIPGFAGPLLEKELSNLGNLLEDPAHPFVVVMGGAKVSDKIEVIHNLAKLAEHILIGGAMANTFLLAEGEEIGKSLAESEKLEVAKDLMKDLGDKLILASDFVKDDPKSADFRYLDLGEESVKNFKEYLGKAKTVFWNGSLGYTEDDRYIGASKAIAEFLAGLKGVTTVVAGGDTVEMITKLDLHDKFSFVSTGGGAALEFLAGDKLPGVEVLK